MLIVMIIGGRVLGPGFGFVLGLLAMLGSALVTGGVGPWLPFQMLGAAWIGLGAGRPQNVVRTDGWRSARLAARGPSRSPRRTLGPPLAEGRRHDADQPPVGSAPHL